MKRNIKAFTLVELLIVILIISILVAVAVPQYQRTVMRSRYQQAVLFGDLCKKAEQIYYMEHGEHTINFNDFTILIPTPSRWQNNFTVSYPWGYCQLRYNGLGFVDMNCYLENAPRYQIRFDTGERTCFGGEEQPNFNAICRAETGKQEPDRKHPTAGWWAWNYSN